MSIQLGALIIALGVALAVLVAVAWRRHLRRLNDETPQERYRRDCQAFRREREARVTARPSEEVWAAGTDGSPSRGKQAVAWVTIASIGGCGGAAAAAVAVSDAGTAAQARGLVGTVVKRGGGSRVAPRRVQDVPVAAT